MIIRQYLPAWLALAVGLALSLLAFKVVEERTAANAEAGFVQAASERLSNFQRNVSSELNILRSIVALYQNSGSVGRSGFSAFVRTSLPGGGVFQALEWIPRVPSASLADYERAARDDGYGDFRVTELSADGAAVPVLARAEYFPVYFVEPYAGNEAALGFDLGSNPVRMAALERARDSGKMVASGKLNLVQLKENNTGIIVFAPVYRKGKPHDSVVQRRRNLAGFSLGVIRVSKLFSDHFHAAFPFDIYLYSGSAMDEQPLYVQDSKGREGAAPALTIAQALSGVKVVKHFDVGDQQWTLIAKPAEPGFNRSVSGSGWLVLLVSLTFSGFLAAYLSMKVRQRERLRAVQNDLIAREEHLSGIMNNAADGIITIDADANIESFNPAAERMFGFRADQVRGQNVSMLMPEPDKSGHDGYIGNYLAGGQGKIIDAGPREVTARHQNGTEFAMSLSVSAMEVHGEKKFIAIVSDITQRKATERQLRQAQKMEAVGQLTGGVAHDFNNLLTAILGNMELLKDCVGDDAKAKRYLETALKAADRGADLVKRLLAFSRKEVLSPVLTDLNELIPNTAALLERTLGGDIEIKTSLAAGLWPTRIDRNLLENALLNLALNARDAMPGGGKITIETANVRLDEDYAAAHDEVAPGPYVMVTVSDTGAGIAPETLARVFEPFFTTKDVDKGTGLGLSMVYGFVKQSGGHAKVYSEEGQGTTVKMYFQKSTASGGVHEEKQNQAAQMPGGDETVLLVEDDGDVRSFAAAALEVLGYTVLEAVDGPAALRLLDRNLHFDLLFTDVVMPNGMNGREVAGEIAKRRPWVKILYTSGYTQTAIVHHGRLDKGVDLLSKPYNKETLAQTVREVLDA